MNAHHSMFLSACQFYMIKELANTHRESIVQACSLNEAEQHAEKLLYQSYLIEPYQLELPVVEELYAEEITLGLPLQPIAG